MANILLLEHEPILAGLICSALYSDGHHIREASNLQTGMQLGNQPDGGYDLILAEVSQSVKLMRSLGPHMQTVKIMLMTDHMSIGAAIYSVWDGVSVLEKPFTAHKLRRTVRETLQRENVRPRDRRVPATRH